MSGELNGDANKEGVKSPARGHVPRVDRLTGSRSKVDFLAQHYCVQSKNRM